MDNIVTTNSTVEAIPLAKEPSLYAKYIKERLNRGTVETEQGFATFEFSTDKIVYIVDLYVLPEFRQKGVAASLADSIISAVKPMGYTQLLGSVDTSTIGHETSAKVLEAYGMTKCAEVNSIHYFIKEI